MGFIDLSLRGLGLDAHDWNGKSDPYLVFEVPTDVKPPAKHFALEIGKALAENLPEFFDGGDNEAGEALGDFAIAVFNHAQKTHKTTKGHVQLYQTEVCSNDLNPIWKPVRFDFYSLCKGNLDANILITCYDWDRFGPSDLIGSVRVKAGELLCESGQEKLFQLMYKSKKPAGQLKLQSKLSDSGIIYLDCKARGQALAGLSNNGLSDPYLVLKIPSNIQEVSSPFAPKGNIAVPAMRFKRGVQKHTHSKSYREVYESEVIKKNLNPDWKAFRLGFYDLCREHPEQVLHIQCWDYNSFRSNKLIGSANVTVRSLLDNQRLEIPLISRDQGNAGNITLDVVAYRINNNINNKNNFNNNKNTNNRGMQQM